MQRFHFHIPYLLRKDINELYIANAIRNFSISTVAIFIPIFLLENGFGFIGIGIYLLIQTIVMAFGAYPFLKVAARFGLKHNMLISSPMMILYFVTLYNIDFLRSLLPDIGVIIILGILVALADSMYWTGFHVHYAKSSQIKKSAKQYGVFNITSTISSAAAPLIGGVLLTAFGFPVMFTIVMSLLIIAVLPLFLSKEKHLPFNVTYKDISSNKHARYIFPFFGEGMHHVALGVAWPLFLYLLFYAYSDIGVIYTIANALFLVTTIYVSHRITELTKYTFLKIGTWFHSISMIVRLFAKSFISMSFAMSYAGFTNAIMTNSYHTTYYNSAKKHGLMTIVFMREFYLNIGRFSMSAILVILLYFFKPDVTLTLLMIIGAFAVLLRANIREDIKVKN